MKRKMVVAFHRSLSLPTPQPDKEKAYHVRSTSLPCRSHPVIAQVKCLLQKLKDWEGSSGGGQRTVKWLCAGLGELKNLHELVDDLFQLPQTQESLRRKEKWADEILDDFLKFVDVYGIVRGALLGFKELQLAAQMAIRRRYQGLHGRLGSYLMAKKKMDKEMAKLVSLLKAMVGRSVAQSPVSDNDAELSGVLRDVKAVTVSVTVFLVDGISGPLRKWRFGLGRSKRQEQGICEVESLDVAVGSIYRSRGQPDEESMQRALKRLEAMEDCISDLESWSESVFRSLIHTRVSLLNILTQ